MDSALARQHDGNARPGFGNQPFVESKTGDAESGDVFLKIYPTAGRAQLKHAEQSDWLKAKGFGDAESFSFVDEKRQHAKLLRQQNCLRLPFVEIE